MLKGRKVWNIYKMVKYLQSVNTNPDKVIMFYSGQSSDYNPAVMVHDKFTEEICVWWGEMTHDKFRRMLTEVKTNYETIGDVLMKGRC